MTAAFRGMGVLLLAVGAGSITLRWWARRGWIFAPATRCRRTGGSRSTISTGMCGSRRGIATRCWWRRSSTPPTSPDLNDAQIVVDSSGGLVSIRTQYTGGDADHPASVEYHIMVPRSANLENVKLINGGLSLSGMAGPVKASSVNGSIRAEQMRGTVDLSTVNGYPGGGFSERFASAIRFR